MKFGPKLFRSLTGLVRDLGHGDFVLNGLRDVIIGDGIL